MIAVQRVNLLSLALVLIGALLSMQLFSEEDKKEVSWDIQEMIKDEITVDLREPIFKDGVLKTEKGGVIFTDCIRIQALMISYSKTESGSTVEAEGDLMVEYGPYVFAGSSLFYDFETNTGTIEFGRTGDAPWYVGGARIDLMADGSYVVYDAYVTTSENIQPDWAVAANKAVVRNYKFLNAKNVQFRLFRFPIFWIPSFRVNMASLLDSPIRYTVRVGGRKGPRIGMVYEMYSSDTLKSYARLDYRLKRGFGGGLELQYNSLNRLTCFRSINYYAKDISLSQPNTQKRYRLQGLYHSRSYDNKTSFHLTYDKLSDRDMATDYQDHGLELATAKRTGFFIHHQERNWIANLLTQIRINNFQSLKQEVPTFAGTIRPYNFGSSGLILQGNYRLSYLDFEYYKLDSKSPDYNSTRVDFGSKLYRPFCFGPVNFTPSAEGRAIFYGNNPKGAEQWLTVGKFQGELNTDVYRCYGPNKHVMIPYVSYEYVTWPSINPDDHHIFDMRDGWFQLNMLTYGIRNYLLSKTGSECITERFFADIYTHAFLTLDALPQTIPKAYADFRYFSTPWMKHSLGTAWDFYHGMLDHFNFTTAVTISEDAALTFQYYHRSAYDWRKVDRGNFILDSFRTVEELEDSYVSDRRDTLLFHFFYRFLPEWSLECQSRHGWNRKTENSYEEYLFSLNGNLRSAWKVRFSYRHKENEDRFSFNIGIGIDKPRCGSEYPVPCLNF